MKTRYSFFQTILYSFYSKDLYHFIYRHERRHGLLYVLKFSLLIAILTASFMLTVTSKDAIRQPIHHFNQWLLGNDSPSSRDDALNRLLRVVKQLPKLHINHGELISAPEHKMINDPTTNTPLFTINTSSSSALEDTNVGYFILKRLEFTIPTSSLKYQAITDYINVMNEAMFNDWLELLPKLPDITFLNGELSLTNDTSQPIVIKDATTEKTLAIIDTGTTYQTLQPNDEALLLMTKHELFIKHPKDHDVISIAWKDLSHQTLDNFFEETIAQLYYAMMLFYIIMIPIFTLLVFIFFTPFVWLFSLYINRLHPTITAQESLRLASVCLTPFYTLFFLSLPNISLFRLFIFTMLGIYYAYFAANAIRNHHDTSPS